MMESAGREKRAVVCAPARRGQPGTPGKDGKPGNDGPQGARGTDARDILAEQEEKCIICPMGKVGPMGPPGDRGEPGEKGNKGQPGTPSVDGIDGDIGPEGDVGPPGYPGKPGGRGPSGRSAEGGVGKPGPKGADGPVGRAGSQGPRGKRNYIYGPPGPIGQPGPNGLDGVNGNVGERGAKGPPGERGADAKFCPCPMELHIISEQKRKPLPQFGGPSVKNLVPPIPPTTKPSPLLPLLSEDDDALQISRYGMSSAVQLHESPTSLELSATKRPVPPLMSAPPGHSEVGPPGERASPVALVGAPGRITGTKKAEEVAAVKPPATNKIATELSTTSTAAPATTEEADSDEDDGKVDVPNAFGSPSPSEQVLPGELNALDEYEETTTMAPTTTRRRFVYVTKRPRQYLFI